MQITLTINGQRITAEVAADEKLLDTIRKLGFTGTKKGCGEGACGSCSVILNGRLVTACLVYSAAANGAAVETIEGLGDALHPHPIQVEFVKAGAVQCGFCTPGMVMSTKALLKANSSPSEEAIKSALDGNLCRCTGYVKIIDGVKNAAKAISSASGTASEVKDA